MPPRWRHLRLSALRPGVHRGPPTGLPEPPHVGSDLADGWACEWISHGGDSVLKASSRSNNAGQANWACTSPGPFKMLQKPYKYQRRRDSVAGAGQGLPVIPKVRQGTGTTGGVRWQCWCSSGPHARGCRVGSAWWKWRRQWWWWYPSVDLKPLVEAVRQLHEGATCAGVRTVPLRQVPFGLTSV